MDREQAVKQLLERAQSARASAKLCLSEGEALQLESRLLVLEALLLLSVPPSA